MAKITIAVDGCDGLEYVLFPGCAYNGNKFKSVKRAYPPMFTAEEAMVEMPVTITDVPRLQQDGSGKIEVTTGDVSVPCIGVFVPTKQQAVFAFTVQEIDGINLGLAYKKGQIKISYPAKREQVYRWPYMLPNEEIYNEIEADIPYRLLSFECADIQEFFKIFFENRKIMEMDVQRPEELPYKEQFQIQRDKFNTMNWTGNYYDVDTLGSWQPGWVGGAMVTYALAKLGGEQESRRTLQTLQHLFENQSPSGLFYGYNNKGGDGFAVPAAKNWLLIRKSADVLYFLFKHFSVLQNIPNEFIEKTKKLADAFVMIWEKYGQFGHYIHSETGEIVVGGSSSAAIIPAALVKAFEYFGNKKYLEIARISAETLYKKEAKKGYTTGGPGEILQCPDSESAFSLLESMVVLYEHTQEEKWLQHSEYLLHFCSSWVVAYNYLFPSSSEFYRLDMKTLGTIFANVQNKHSAPGICTLSGNCIKKLYDFTGNEKYKEIYYEITRTISQYMSTAKRPLYSWGVPKDGMVNGNIHVEVEREKLPQGFICERVNMSDWETQACVGGVFKASCWCETSNLLFLAER